MDENIPLNHLTMILTSFYNRLEGGQWFIRVPWARKNIRRDSKDLSTLLETSPSDQCWFAASLDSLSWFHGSDAGGVGNNNKTIF